MGIESIKHASDDITLAGETTTKSLASSYRNGLLVAVSPGNLVFWVSIFGTVLASSFDASDKASFIVVGTGILTGILLHDIALMAIVATTRRAKNKTAIMWVSIVAGLVLIGFAAYFGYEFGRTIWN